VTIIVLVMAAFLANKAQVLSPSISGWGMTLLFHWNSNLALIFAICLSASRLEVIV
jgi:hypothetical protein